MMFQNVLDYEAQHTPPAQRSAKTNTPVISDGLARRTGVGECERRFFKAILYIPGPVGTSISTPHPLVSPSFVYPKS